MSDWRWVVGYDCWLGQAFVSSMSLCPRHETSSLAQTRGMWVRIPLEVWKYFSVSSVFVLSCVGNGLERGLITAPRCPTSVSKVHNFRLILMGNRPEEEIIVLTGKPGLGFTVIPSRSTKLTDQFQTTPGSRVHEASPPKSHRSPRELVFRKRGNYTFRLSNGWKNNFPLYLIWSL
jgi:hypothetical protein